MIKLIEYTYKIKYRNLVITKVITYNNNETKFKIYLMIKLYFFLIKEL